MYRIKIPGCFPEIEKTLDDLIKKPFVVIDDEKLARRLGIHTRPLRKKGILGIYSDSKNHETIAVLKIKDVEKRNMRGYAKGVEYDFNFTPKLKIKYPQI